MPNVENTIRYFPDTLITSLATDTTLGTATRHDWAAKTIDIAETSGRSFKSVEVVIRYADGFTSANEITGWRIGIKLGAAATSDVDVSFTMANLGDHLRDRITRDVTSYFASNFGAGASQTCVVSLAASTTSASTIGGNITCELVITYQHDGTATTLTKTVPILIQSHHTNLTTSQIEIGTTGGAASTDAPANQIPALDTFLEESTKTYKDAAIYWSGSTGSGTGDLTAYVQIDAVTEVARGTREAALDTVMPYEDVYNYPHGTHSTASAHAFSLRADVTGKLNCAGAILYVTFTYAASSARVTAVVQVPITEQSSDNPGWRDTAQPVTGGDAADVSRLVARFEIQEPGTITLKQSGMVLNMINILGGTQSAYAGTQTVRVYSTASIGENFVVHRGDCNTGAWTIARGSNALLCGFNNSLNYRTAVNGIATVVYSCDKPAAGAWAANRPLYFGAVSFDSTVALIRDVASGSAATTPAFTAPWFTSASWIAAWGRGTASTIQTSIGLAVEAGEFDGEGWICTPPNVHTQMNMGEISTTPLMWPTSRMFNNRSGASGRLDPANARRQLAGMRFVQMYAWGYWFQVHNCTFTVSGVVTVNGVAAANGGIILVMADDNEIGAGERAADTVIAGGAGGFTCEVPWDTRGFFVLYTDGGDQGMSSVIPGTPCAIDIYDAPSGGSGYSRSRIVNV